MGERADHEEEIAQDRELIRRSRVIIAETDKLVATSQDRIVESVKRIRAIKTEKAATPLAPPD